MILMLSLLLLPHAHAAELTVAKKDFVEGVRAGLPKSFCAEKTYFRSCFDASEEKCVQTATGAVAACLTQLEKDVPAVLHQPKDGGTWGEKIGTCAGEKFEKELAKTRKNSADCNDASKWK